jgi:two-component system sensor histidine kinase MprB
VPLRRRISLAAAAAVAVAVALAVVVCYTVVRNQLFGQVDSELRTQEARVVAGAGIGPSSHIPGNPANQGGAAQYVQFVKTNGSVDVISGELQLPTNAAVVAVAAGKQNNLLMDATVSGNDLRILAFHWEGFVPDTQTTFPIAIELARPLGPTNSILSSLRLVLALVFLAGIALAAALGRMAARRVLRPLAEVTETARTIGETDDLSLRLAVHADDEVGELAARFNEMLTRLDASREALDASVRSQRQLVADASHELRTPVTSLRTNIEVLLAGGQLDDEDRRRLLADVVEQSEELSTLVSDLIEVARGDLPDESQDDTRLDRVVEECLARARRNAPQVHFDARLEPVLVRGNPERLSRAVNNLLDNAARHTAPDGPVQVVVGPDGVCVRDHGSGIDPEDLPYVFDRFYRGADSRSRQGSGLGLAIVRQVAHSHGGTVTAANAGDGGAVFKLRLPASRVPADPSEGAGDLRYGAGGLATRA